MSLENLERVGQDITTRLDKIRNRVGAPMGEYSAPRNTIKLISGRDLQERAKLNPGEPIIINGQFYLEYIKDNSYNSKRFDLEVGDDGKGCFVSGNKVHFYYCKTLEAMRYGGRGQRYCETPKIDNMQMIDLSPVKENVMARLAWCKYCIGLLGIAGGMGQIKVRMRKSRIAEYADAKELMQCVEACYKNTSEATQQTKNLFDSVLN